MMDLDRLRTFQMLADTLHFRRAAERLGITQSAVSQQIATLERDLGVPLFERIGRRVYLTDAGRVLAVEAPRVLSSVSRAREAIAAVSRGDTGRLRVGASTTPGLFVLPEVLGRFRVDFPLIQIAFRIENSTRIEALVLGNDVDLAVCGMRATHEELFEIDLGEDRVVAVGAPALLGRTRRVSPGDLSRFPFVAREAGSATRGAVERALDAVGLRLTPAFELPSPEACVRAAEAGLGFAFVPERAVEEALETRRLVELRVDGLDIRRRLYALHHRDKRVTPPMRELVELLRARLVGTDKRR
jgi:DNA-binding transcriptional LysR family regulator